MQADLRRLLPPSSICSRPQVYLKISNCFVESCGGYPTILADLAHGVVG